MSKYDPRLVEFIRRDMKSLPIDVLHGLYGTVGKVLKNPDECSREIRKTAGGDPKPHDQEMTIDAAKQILSMLDEEFALRRSTLN